MSEAYVDKQIVGIDLHRRRSMPADDFHPNCDAQRFLHLMQRSTRRLLLDSGQKAVL